MKKGTIILPSVWFGTACGWWRCHYSKIPFKSQPRFYGSSQHHHAQKKLQNQQVLQQKHRTTLLANARIY